MLVFGACQAKIFFKKKFSSPSGCLTGVGKVAGEMITKILQIIETVMNRIHPQSRSPRAFCSQTEFPF
jgi:hypothetical protein